MAEDIRSRRGSIIFSKGGWGGKFWKKNVCWYTYQRVHTWRLDKHATLSFFFPFNRIVINFCFVLLLSFIFEIWKGGGCNSRNPLSRSAKAEETFGQIEQYKRNFQAGNGGVHASRLHKFTPLDPPQWFRRKDQTDPYSGAPRIKRITYIHMYVFAISWEIAECEGGGGEFYQLKDADMKYPRGWHEISDGFRVNVVDVSLTLVLHPFESGRGSWIIYSSQVHISN